jgi:hypothetical protein
MTLTPQPLLVPRSKNRVKLNLYSPNRPSWPVKRVKPTYVKINEYSCKKVSYVINIVRLLHVSAICVAITEEVYYKVCIHRDVINACKTKHILKD